MSDSLEDLLKSLSVDDSLSVAVASAPPIPKQPPSKQPPADDLEDLLATLGAPIEAGGNKKKDPFDDELSMLLNNTTPAAQQKFEPVVSKSGGDDFDEILQSLESQSTIKTTEAPRNVQPVRSVASIQPSQQSVVPVPSAAPVKSVAQPSWAPPRQVAAPSSNDDLDSLLASLSETAEHIPPEPSYRATAPSQPQPQQAVQQYRAVPSAGQPRPQQQQAIPQYKAPTSDPSKDISSILSGLEAQFGGGNTSTVGSNRDSFNSRIQKSSEDLNNLLGALETDPTHEVAKPKSLVDVDLLKKQLYDEGYFDGDPSHMGGCARCHRGISGQKIDAEGKSFHVDCWVCNSCQKPLLTAQYYIYESLPHCDGCYRSLYCPKCGKCDQIILGEVVTAMSKSWHPHCFCCSHCQKPFTSAFYQGKNGLPYCDAHYRIYTA